MDLDVPYLFAQAGLKNYNGSVNLVLNMSADSPRGAMLFSTGSEDQIWQGANSADWSPTAPGIKAHSYFDGTASPFREQLKAASQ